MPRRAGPPGFIAANHSGPGGSEATENHVPGRLRQLLGEDHRIGPIREQLLLTGAVQSSESLDRRFIGTDEITRSTTLPALERYPRR